MDIQPVEHSTLQSEYCSGNLSLGRKALLKDVGRYLRLPYSTLVNSVFGPPIDTSQKIRDKFIEDGVVVRTGTNLRWAAATISPAQSDVSESVAFQPLGTIISNIFDQMPDCSVYFEAYPSMAPLSERGDTSCPDAYIMLRPRTTDRTHWFDIPIPFEFKKYKNSSVKRDNEQKIIWSMHNIMREDPLRRFAIGITVEDTEMRIWYCNRALLAASEPMDFVTQIDDVISLFSLIGAKTRVGLGWDPTMEQLPEVDGKTQYRFTIGNQHFTTTHPLSTFGADAMVSRGTRVYQAVDDEGRVVAIKDSWRDEDREPEGAILESILRDIREKLGDEEATKAEKYFVRVRVYGDVIIPETGTVDKTLNPLGIDPDALGKWIALDIDPITSETRHLSSSGHIPGSDDLPVKLERYHHARNAGTTCKVHTRTVYDEVGVPLMKLTSLVDSLNCLLGVLEALYFIHRVGWVHRDVSVANGLWVERDGQLVGKLTDFEYAKKFGTGGSHDVRTGTMHFMALEVESQRYLFRPNVDPATAPLGASTSAQIPFRMNTLHDLESEWWMAMWILFYHTDEISPSEKAEEQLRWFNRAFPYTVNHTSRRDFFLSYEWLQAAYETLSKTYNRSCGDIGNLSIYLRESYQEAEKSYPFVLDDAHLKSIYEKIQLVPLHEHLAKKSGQDDSPPRQTVKRVKLA